MRKSKGNVKKAAFIPLLLISVFILIPQGATANLVICFEKDGHINVEIAHYGVCCPHVKKTLSESHSCSFLKRKSSRPNNCHPCFDLTFSDYNSVHHILAGQCKIRLIKTFLSMISAFQIPQSDEIITGELHPRPLPAANFIISFLDSTILLV